MSILITDYRHKLPRASWSIGTRIGNPTSASLHYNGPPVYRDPYDQLVIDAQYHMGPYLRADGLQYHLAIMPSGEILQCRNFDAILWHCGNAQGNEYSMSIHIPIGGNQQPTEPQWQSAIEVFAWMHERWNIARNRIYGHFEWPRSDGRPQSACPGPHLKRRLIAWRDDLTGRYEVVTDSANVRQAPTTAAGIAAVYPQRHQFSADSIKTGQAIGGDNIWLHSADGLGFVHRSTVRKVA